MSLVQAIILGIVQGATEFLPVSSSGHLVLVPWWLGWNLPSDLVFTVATHLGTLCAVLIYFRRDWMNVFRGGLHLLRTRELSDANSRLFVLLIIGSIPVGIVGYLFADTVANSLDTPIAAASFLFVTAALLAFAEHTTTAAKANRSIQQMTWQDGLTVGAAQMVSLLPGVSRSGSTIAAGLFKGITREEAARFSFLLGTPAIIGAGILTGLHLLASPDMTQHLPMLAAGFVSAALVGYAAIALLLAHLRRHRLYAFAIYCTFVGIVSLLAAILGR